MKHFLFAILCFSVITAQSQIPAHLQCKEPVKLLLSIDPPLPRQNTYITVMVDFASILDSLHTAAVRQFPSSKLYRYKADGSRLFTFDGLPIGKHELGPYSFVLNEQPYTTDKIIFTVADSLRNDDFGLWIRHEKTNDSTFCFAIEQKEILENKRNLSKRDYILQDTLQNGSKGIYIDLKESDYETIRFSHYSNGGSLEEAETDRGKILYHKYRYYVCFVKKPNSRDFVLTREHIRNLPKDFKFEPITMR